MTGQTIVHYHIREKLGEGGMGVVYRAEDTKLLRTVAVKFLSSRAMTDPVAKARFLREAQAAGSIDHPNICTVHGIEECDGHLFLVMAYIDGPSLAERVRIGPLAPSAAVDIVIQVGDGLHAAHEKGIVHRDVKCANILLTSRGVPKINDFGLALFADRSRLTQPGTVMGTVTSMAPEQVLAKDVDRRADIWSLGVVLYETITGQPPFSRKDTQSSLRAILEEDPGPLRRIQPALPSDIDWILGKALAKKPEERYQHMDDLVVDLRTMRRRMPEAKSIPPRPPSKQQKTMADLPTETFVESPSGKPGGLKGLTTRLKSWFRG